MLNNKNILKVFLAILFFICLAEMPYGFYQFVRFASLFVFAYLAYSSNEENKKNEAFIYIGLAILFQPLIKIALGRTIWNIVDIIVGTFLIVSIFRDNKVNK